jgi:hypothetical protein
LRRQKSSYSGDSSNGLNIATALLRESDAPATVLSTTPTRLAGLLTAIKTDRLNAYETPTPGDGRVGGA